MWSDFSVTYWVYIGLIFCWAAVIRSGFGFGGAVVGLPLLLFIRDQPVYWLPIIGAHLLFFAGLTIGAHLRNVDWAYLKKTGVIIVPAALAGVFGLLNLPNAWLVFFIYSITLFYAFVWMLELAIVSHHRWLDNILLMLGGYVAGTSLTGAPLMVAVFMRNVPLDKLRNTLFVLWFVLVSIKMCTFAVLRVEMHLLVAMALVPIATVGHILGLKLHNLILRNDRLFKRVMGFLLFVVSLLGLWRMIRHA